jgi:hypothetical protein
MYGEGARDAARRMLPEPPDARFVPAEAVRETVGAAVKDGTAQVVLLDATGERMVGMYGRMAR